MTIIKVTTFLFFCKLIIIENICCCSCKKKQTSNSDFSKKNIEQQTTIKNNNQDNLNITNVFNKNKKNTFNSTNNTLNNNKYNSGFFSNNNFNNRISLNKNLKYKNEVDYINDTIKSYYKLKKEIKDNKDKVINKILKHKCKFYNVAGNSCYSVAGMELLTHNKTFINIFINSLSTNTNDENIKEKHNVLAIAHLLYKIYITPKEKEEDNNIGPNIFMCLKFLCFNKIENDTAQRVLNHWQIDAEEFIHIIINNLENELDNFGNKKPLYTEIKIKDKYICKHEKERTEYIFPIIINFNKNKKISLKNINSYIENKEQIEESACENCTKEENQKLRDLNVNNTIECTHKNKNKNKNKIEPDKYVKCLKCYTFYNKDCKACNKEHINNFCTETNNIINREIKIQNIIGDSTIIQLKRFEKDNSGNSNKIHAEVELEDTITIKTNTGDTKFSLNGIICHSGGMNIGHYYAWIKIDNKWYKFDDTNQFITTDNILIDQYIRQDCYILDYTKISN